MSPIRQVDGRALGCEHPAHIIVQMSPNHNGSAGCDPVYREFRAGDVRHSQSDISKARLLRYEPAFELRAGICAAMPWYVKSLCGS